MIGFVRAHPAGSKVVSKDDERCNTCEDLGVSPFSAEQGLEFWELVAPAFDRDRCPQIWVYHRQDQVLRNVHTTEPIEI